MGKRDDIQVKVTPNTYNMFVSPGAKFEFEIDLMDTETKGATSNTRYGLVAIRNLTKTADVVPINNKTPEEMIIVLNNIFTSMGKPKQLYTDESSSMKSANMIKFINGTVQTSTHAHTVERFIRTFKDNLYRTLDSSKQDKTNWIKHIDNIIKK